MNTDDVRALRNEAAGNVLLRLAMLRDAGCDAAISGIIITAPDERVAYETMMMLHGALGVGSVSRDRHDATFGTTHALRLDVTERIGSMNHETTILHVIWTEA